jgi:hypothetical protein
VIGFRVVLGFRVQGIRSITHGVELKVESFGCRGLRFGVWGSGIRVWD